MPGPPPPPPPPGFAPMFGGPPPPPPPPPGGAPMAAPPSGKGRGALLGDIAKGARLKKTVTNDRSGALIGNKESSGPKMGGMGTPPAIPGMGMGKPPSLGVPPVPGANRPRSSSDSGGPPGGGGGGGGGVDAPPQLAGLFAGGMPKLRKTGGAGIDTGANGTSAYSDSETTSKPVMPSRKPVVPKPLGGRPSLPSGFAPGGPSSKGPATAPKPRMPLPGGMPPRPNSHAPSLPPPAPPQPIRPVSSAPSAPPPPPPPVPQSAAPPIPGFAARSQPGRQAPSPTPFQQPPAPPPPPPSAPSRIPQPPPSRTAPPGAPPAPPSPAPQLPLTPPHSQNSFATAAAKAAAAFTPAQPPTPQTPSAPPPPPPSAQPPQPPQSRIPAPRREVANFTLQSNINSHAQRNRASSGSAGSALGMSHNGASTLTLNGGRGNGGRLLVDDVRFKWKREDELPRPRERFAGFGPGVFRYRSGRVGSGSSVPFDLKVLEGT